MYIVHKEYKISYNKLQDVLIINENRTAVYFTVQRGGGRGQCPKKTFIIFNFVPKTRLACTTFSSEVVKNLNRNLK